MSAACISGFFGIGAAPSVHAPSWGVRKSSGGLLALLFRGARASVSFFELIIVFTTTAPGAIGKYGTYGITVPALYRYRTLKMADRCAPTCETLALLTAEQQRRLKSEADAVNQGLASDILALHLRAAPDSTGLAAKVVILSVALSHQS